MALTGIGGGVYAPGKKQGARGVTGGVNAGGKQPMFPRGLDEHFGVAGVSGHVSAPGPKVAPALGGVTGHTLAPGAPAPPRVPSAASFRSGSMRGVSGAAFAPESKNQQILGRLGKTIGTIAANERGISQFLRTGVGGMERAQRAAGREQNAREARLNTIRSQKAAAGGPFGVPGAIQGFGQKLAGKEMAGAATIFGTSGVPGAIGKGLGSAGAELINIPTQILPSSYQTIAAGVKAVGGHPQELQKLSTEFDKNSVIGASMKAASNAVHGDVPGAVKSIKSIPSIAGKHPVGTGLEVFGGAAALDRGLGAIADHTGLRGNMIDNGGASIAEPSRPGRELVPGGATKPQPAYSKGLLRQKVQKYLETRPLTNMERKLGLERHFNGFQGQMRRIVTMGREMTKVAGRKRVKGMSPGEMDMVVPFGKWAAHPDVRSPKGDYPLWRDQVSERIERLNRMTPNSEEHNNPIPIEARDAQIHYLQRILDDRNLQKNEGRKAVLAAERLAAGKGRLKPELQQTHFTPEEMRVAELKPAFQEYFHDQQPRIETSVPAGQSPFFLGDKNIPVDRVDQMLHDKGFRREQRFFTSDNPNRTEAEAFRGGYSPGGEKTSKGVLTGQNFIRGQSDLTYEHAVAQHAYEQLLVNIAHGDREMVDNYFHDKNAAAELIRAKLGDIGPGMRQFYENHINQLEHEHGARFWEERNGRGPSERANETKKILERLYPDRKFSLAHVARPFATARYRGAIAPKAIEDISDRMDPYQHMHAPEDQVSLFPQVTEGDAGMHSGHVGLIDKVVADKMRAYDAMVKNVSLSQQFANFWRRSNIAFSVRHVPGVMKEMGYRMMAGNIGPLSALTAHRVMPYIREYAEQSKDPKVKMGMKRLEAYIRGTTAAYSDDLRRRISEEDLYSKPRIYAATKALKGNPITGNALKLIQGVLKGKGKFPGYTKITDTLLKYQRNTIEHPPQVAGLGRNFRDEYKALTGKSMKVIGKFSELEKEFLAGRLNRASVDQSIQAFRDYWGEWNRADPTTRKVMVLSPFFQWYVNSLRFLYHTMPVHHPEKTGVLVMLENATEEQRKAEGQGYHNFFELNPGQLEPSQQGSIPFGQFPGGEPARAGEEYYAPQGAVSGGLDTALNALLPYAFGTLTTAAGYDPLTKKVIEEVNPETGKKEQVTNQNRLIQLAGLSLLESFMPAFRYYESATKPRPEEKQDPLTRLLMKTGLPPGVAYALRPLRTEATYKVKEPKGGGGFGGFGSFSKSGGFSGF